MTERSRPATDDQTGRDLGPKEREGEPLVASWHDQPARLIVNVVELRKRLGQRREVPVDVVLARQTVLDSRTCQTPVVGTLTVESIERGVSVVGQVSFDWQSDCRRCLELVAGTREIDIAEICLVDAPEDADIIDFDGEKLDLVPILRDAVGLSLPLAPLCRDDCAGPDPDRYPALTEQAMELDRPPDPRWAALSELALSDLKPCDLKPSDLKPSDLKFDDLDEPDALDLN